MTIEEIRQEWWQVHDSFPFDVYRDFVDKYMEKLLELASAVKQSEDQVTKQVIDALENLEDAYHRVDLQKELKELYGSNNTAL